MECNQKEKNIQQPYTPHFSDMKASAGVDMLSDNYLLSTQQKTSLPDIEQLQRRVKMGHSRRECDAIRTFYSERERRSNAASKSHGVTTSYGARLVAIIC